jgi:hypothetical protein
LKLRVGRINEKFEIFYGKKLNLEHKARCLRSEVGALLTKAAILIARQSKYTPLTSVEMVREHISPLLRKAWLSLSTWHGLIEEIYLHMRHQAPETSQNLYSCLDLHESMQFRTSNNLQPKEEQQKVREQKIDVGDPKFHLDEYYYYFLNFLTMKGLFYQKYLPNDPDSGNSTKQSSFL